MDWCKKATEKEVQELKATYGEERAESMLKATNKAINRILELKRDIMPDEIKSILLSGKMTKAEANKVHRYYIDKACRKDWFGSYGVDHGGHYYHYVVGYRSGAEVTYKVYLEGGE